MNAKTISRLSINQNVCGHVAELCNHATGLQINYSRNDDGVAIIDAGLDVPGSIEAGLQIAEICLGGLGHVRLDRSGPPEWPLSLNTQVSNPILACLGSQYAGWKLSHGEGKDMFYALGSGPGRALAQKEVLFKELNYVDKSETGVLVLEVSRPPPRALLLEIANACQIEPKNLTIIITPTQSLAGSVQIVARVLEVALHKAHELGFALHHIIDGNGCAPLAPPAPDGVIAMGRTNDAILFAGVVHLFVEGEYEDAHNLCDNLPSSTSKDYGKPFAETFKKYNYDFFKIDPLLFSPAQVSVTHLPSGHTFRAGRIDLDALRQSFDY